MKFESGDEIEVWIKAICVAVIDVLSPGSDTEILIDRCRGPLMIQFLPVFSADRCRLQCLGYQQQITGSSNPAIRE
jgi:hypothetical protein